MSHSGVLSGLPREKYLVAAHVPAKFDDGSKLYHREQMPRRATRSAEIELKRSFTAAIRERMQQDNLTISALAERMGTGRTAVRRLLDAGNTSITFRSISRAAQAVGLKLSLIAEPMSPDDLGKLAHRLSKSRTKAESAKLAARITEGFYAGS